MTLISSTRMTAERDAVSQSTSLLVKNMNDEARERLEQWIPEIEEHAVRSIAELPYILAARRRPEILAAAALYQAFLEFESRTGLAVRTPYLSEALGIKLCSLSEAYGKLFDRKVRVLHHNIECIQMLSDDPADLVKEVIASLVSALEEQNPTAADWFAEVQEDAIVMVDSLKKQQQGTYEPDVIAAAAVFGAIRRQTAQEVVHVAQKDIAQTCRFSPSLVSKVWLEFFCERRLSSIIDTEVRES
jgi:hypothetical protein